MIKNGADINSKDINGCSPICYAAQHGSINITMLLIANGADIDAQDNLKMNALHYAMSKNYTKSIIMLLSYDASLTVKTINGEKPIECALKGMNKAAFKSSLFCIHKQQQ